MPPLRRILGALVATLVLGVYAWVGGVLSLPRAKRRKRARRRAGGGTPPA